MRAFKPPVALGLLIVLLATLSGIGGYFYGTQVSTAKAMPPGVQPALQDHAASQPVAAIPKSNARKVLYWTDPMTPGSRFDKPGKSPFMDMELEPVYAEEGDGASPTPTRSVRVSADTLQNMGVRTVMVEQGQLAHRVEAVGVVKPDEHRIEAVHAHTAGWVEKVHVRAAGDAVRAGQPMFELYSPDLVAAQEEYLLALRHSDAALMQAAEQKLHLLYFHEQEMQRLKSSGQVQRRIMVTAPGSGVVSELMVRQGMAVTAGQSVYILTNLASVWVNAQLPEAQAQWASPGTATEVRFAALPGKVFKGKVEYLYPEVSEASRTLSARIPLANPGGLLKPNMVADVRLLGGVGAVTALVPREAVIETGTRKVVIVADGRGKFHPQEVVTGTEAEGKVEILSGLSAGQEVVASGQFLIDSEANLKATLGRLGGK